MPMWDWREDPLRLRDRIVRSEYRDFARSSTRIDYDVVFDNHCTLRNSITMSDLMMHAYGNPARDSRIEGAIDVLLQEAYRYINEHPEAMGVSNMYSPSLTAGRSLGWSVAGDAAWSSESDYGVRTSSSAVTTSGNTVGVQSPWQPATYHYPVTISIAGVAVTITSAYVLDHNDWATMQRVIEVTDANLSHLPAFQPIDHTRTYSVVISFKDIS